MTWPTKTDFVDGDVLTAAQVNNIGTNLNEFDPTSATNGQIWVADGAGGGTYSTVSSGAYTLLNTSSLASLSTFTVSGIPGDYRHLYFNLEGMYAPSTSYFYVRVAASADSYNTVSHFQGPSNTTVTQEATYNDGNLAPASANGRAIGTSSAQPTRISGFIYNYASTAEVHFVRMMVGRVPAVTDLLGIESNRAAAISQMTWTFSTAVTAGTATLYGVK